MIVSVFLLLLGILLAPIGAQDDSKCHTGESFWWSGGRYSLSPDEVFNSTVPHQPDCAPLELLFQSLDLIDCDYADPNNPVILDAESACAASCSYTYTCTLANQNAIDQINALSGTTIYFTQFCATGPIGGEALRPDQIRIPLEIPSGQYLHGVSFQFYQPCKDIKGDNNEWLEGATLEALLDLSSTPLQVGDTFTQSITLSSSQRNTIPLILLTLLLVLYKMN